LKDVKKLDKSKEKKTYIALERSSLKRDYTKVLIAIGLLVGGFGASMPDLFLILSGVVLIYISLYKKKVVFDEAGITTYYNGVFYKKKTSYPYTAYDIMRFEVNYGPEIRVGFVRSGMNYYYLFKREDSDEVMRMALNAHPTIKVVQMGAGRNK
jgi:hypothetical protein